MSDSQQKDGPQGSRIAWAPTDLSKIWQPQSPAFGTKRTYRVALHMSAFGGKVDITQNMRRYFVCWSSSPASNCKTLAGNNKTGPRQSF